MGLWVPAALTNQRIHTTYNYLLLKYSCPTHSLDNILSPVNDVWLFTLTSIQHADFDEGTKIRSRIRLDLHHSCDAVASGVCSRYDASWPAVPGEISVCDLDQISNLDRLSPTVPFSTPAQSWEILLHPSCPEVIRQLLRLSPQLSRVDIRIHKDARNFYTDCSCSN